ncbi:MAG: hypothetical protein SVY15_02765 [Halobacteriota archaeon]|nr:hypothetical protein [Halobacteriota archaeon]
MGLFSDTDWGCIKELLRPVERVLGSDLEKLKRMDEIKRTEIWNNIASNLEKFEERVCGDVEADISEEISGKFSLARLLLATTAYVNCEDSQIIKKFNETELNLLKDLERYVAFEILSIDESVERIGRKEAGLYEMITDYYEKGYNNLDEILDDPSILRDLKVALKNRYTKNHKRMKEITIACIERYGLSWMKASIIAKIKESEERRNEILSESQQKIEELEEKLQHFGALEADKMALSGRISQLEADLLREGMEKDTALKALESIESDKKRLDQRYSEMARLLDDQMGSIEEKRRELEGKEAELEIERLEYKKQMQEENQRMVEGELREISILKEELQNKEDALAEDKREVELKKGEISEKLDQLAEVISGKPIRFVTREDAKLCELNYIARFDKKMHEFPLKLFNPLDDKEYKIKSWENHYRNDSREEAFTEDVEFFEIETNPLNIRSVYLVEEKRFKLFGEGVKKIAVEAVSFNHLRDFANYGFDTSRATLSEFLMLLSRSISSAEIGKYLHIIGITSPTGWDERVIKEIESSEFAHNYVSRYVSVCLIDSVTGEVYYNPADERMAGFINFFKPEFDIEKVERVKKHIIEIFEKKDYAVFSDVVEETGDDRAIVNKAFYDLEREEKGRTRYIKDVGLVIEIAR